MRLIPIESQYHAKFPIYFLIFSQSLFHINISIFLCCLNLENNIIKNCSKRVTSRATFIVRIDNAIELLVVKSSFAFIMSSP